MYYFKLPFLPFFQSNFFLFSTPFFVLFNSIHFFSASALCPFFLKTNYLFIEKKRDDERCQWPLISRSSRTSMGCTKAGCGRRGNGKGDNDYWSRDLQGHEWGALKLKMTIGGIVFGFIQLLKVSIRLDRLIAAFTTESRQGATQMVWWRHPHKKEPWGRI